MQRPASASRVRQERQLYVPGTSSTANARPQSAGVRDKVQPTDPERIEWSGRNVGGRIDLLRDRPSSAAKSELSIISVDSSKAFKGLYEAKNEEDWLEVKFNRSGAPAPADGELTVVIEYCYNSGTDQLSTHHDEQRYHEEAELVKKYIQQYFPAATVHVVASDFRRTRFRGGSRLGAFEVDARLRFDGELCDVNLWSKLHTRLWPVWPDWQDALRHRLPVFHLLLRPCAVLDDGTIRFLTGPTLTVVSSSSGQTMVEGQVEAHQGVAVRLLRGTYHVNMPESDKYYAESALLDLSQVPVPHSAGHPIELLVPMFAKPRLTIRVQSDSQGGGLLPFCEASMSDVLVSISDRRTGEEIARLTPPPGGVQSLDLSEHKPRIRLPSSTLADALAAGLHGLDNPVDRPSVDAASGWPLLVRGGANRRRVQGLQHTTHC